VGATVQIQDLILALSHGRATFPAEVGPGSTTTQINLAGLNLNNINLAGNFVMLDAGALGSGSPPTVTTISSNTATALTVPALPQAPTTGSLLWIFAVATIQANVGENVAQVGGSAVPSPGSPYSGPVLPIGGNDGTNARALATDSAGRVLILSASALSNYIAQGTSVAATTPLLLNYGNTKAHFIPPATGHLTLSVAVSAAAVVSISRNAGAATPIWDAINSGASLTAGAEYAFDIPVDASDTIDFEVSAAVTLNVFKLYFTYGL